MNKTNQYLQYLPLFFLVFTLFSPSSLIADANSKEVKKLKAASLNCDIGAFRQYMPAGTYSKVAKFDEQMQQLETFTESILTKSIQKFGSGVEETTTGIRIPISGKDPRWINLFGPQWESLVKSHPEGPFHFKMDLFMKWEQECKVIQNFQACLEDKEFCSEYYIEGSAIRMAKKDNLWKLVFDLPLDKEKQAEMMTSLIFNTAIWTDNYLTQHKDTLANDDFKYQFASDYFLKMNQLFSELSLK